MSSFVLSISEFAEKAGDRADEAVRHLVLEVWARIVKRSPVDLGIFRASWFYAAGIEGKQVSWPSYRTVVDGTLKTLPAPGPPHIERGAARVVHVIRNELSYARRLEYGWSSQAPGGFVRITLLEAPAIMADAVREVSR
jgi:hypothetical protein